MTADDEGRNEATGIGPDVVGRRPEALAHCLGCLEDWPGATQHAWRPERPGDCHDVVAGLGGGEPRNELDLVVPPQSRPRRGGTDDEHGSLHRGAKAAADDRLDSDPHDDEGTTSGR